MIENCKQCSMEFKPSRRGTLFCETKCRNKYNNAKQWERKKQKRKANGQEKQNRKVVDRAKRGWHSGWQKGDLSLALHGTRDSKETAYGTSTFNFT